MKKFLPLVIVLTIAFAVWALLGFPQDFDLTSTKILSALTLMSTIFTVTKGFKETFFDKPPKTFIEELSDQAHPLKVQLVDSEKEVVLPATRIDNLEKIRALSSTENRDQVVETVAKILGDKSDSFWMKIDADPKEILSSLAKSPFWLEGLVLAFEENNGVFPKNDARVLRQVLLTQWTTEKLATDKLISLDVLQKQLGKLAQRRYPELRYPDEYARSIYPSPYSNYERLVESIGVKSFSENFTPYRTFWRWFFALFFKNPKTIIEFAERFAGPSRTILLLPLYIPLTLLSLFKTLVTLPFVWVERKVESYAYHYENTSNFRRHLEMWWYKYRKFKLRARRFFGIFSIRRALNISRGKLIIESAKRAGILDSNGEYLWFTHTYWRDFFTAWNLVYTNSFNDFLREHIHNRYRRRDPLQKEIVAIMASGLCRFPADGVELVIPHDPIAASKCYVTLDDIPLDARDDLKNRMLDSIVKDLKEVEHDGNSSFCIDSIRAMRSLSDDPYYAHVALEKIPEIYDFRYRPDAAKLIASFGWPVFDMLTTRIKTADESFIPDILIALGELRNTHAIPVLRTLLESAKSARVKMMAAVVLATYFKDEAGIPALEKYLRFEIPEKDEVSPWYYFDACGEDAIEFGLGVMERAALAPKDWHVEDPFRRMTDPMLKKLGDDYKNNSKVETLLLEALSRSQQPRMARFLIEALGKINSQNAIPVLIKFMIHEDDYLRDTVINALKEIDNAMLCSEVTGLLYSSNLLLVKDAISVLSMKKCLDAIPALIQKLDSDEIEKWNENDDGYPIALHAVVGLMAIGTGVYEEKAPNKVRKAAAERCLNTAADWFNAHLEDNRKLRYHDRTVSSESLWQLYILKASNEKARDYYFKWIQEHPEDSI